MWKCFICLAALAWIYFPLSCEAAAASTRLSFQGKASAQITRKVSVPFAMLVREVPISVDAACCAGVSPKTHQAALDTMVCCQIEIL